MSDQPTLNPSEIASVQDKSVVESSKNSGLFAPVWRIYDYLSSVSWTPTSMKLLEEAERRLFKSIKSCIKCRMVPVWSGRYQVWTIGVNCPSSSSGLQLYQINNLSVQQTQLMASVSEKIPLVMVHGFGGGVGLWAQNLDILSKERPVYAFDLLGFARSSRPKFSSDSTLAETEWVRSIEEWRREMCLDKMILLGHSLGGYLASAYALEHPERVRHLVLVEPWGFPPKPPNHERVYALPVWVRTLVRIASMFNPLSTLRAAGPWGPSLVKRFRADLGKKFKVDGDEDAVYDYIYHCNAQMPSGEVAFKTLASSFGWAKRPMIERLPALKTDVPMTFIFGSRSWIDCSPGYEMQQNLRPNSFVNVHIVSGGGHHVYADQPTIFNNLIGDICRAVDNNYDTAE